jgi:hypothetical protein
MVVAGVGGLNGCPVGKKDGDGRGGGGTVGDGTGDLEVVTRCTGVSNEWGSKTRGRRGLGLLLCLCYKTWGGRQVAFGVVPRRGVGTYAFGFPPCWLRQVAPLMWPGALFLQVALEWVAFAVLPCVQQ